MSAPGYEVKLFSLADSSTVNWRLLSANNREVGRGASPAGDPIACRLLIERLRRNLSSCQTRVRPAAANRWRWEILCDDEPVAVAGHAFDRVVRCEQGLFLFVSVFGTAPLRPGVSIARGRGRPAIAQTMLVDAAARVRSAAS